MAVGTRDVRGQRHALPVSEDMVLAASLTSVHGAWAGLLTCMDGTYRGRVDHCSRPVNAVGTAQPGQQLSVQLVPHTRRMPVAKAPPARHPAHTHLDRQVLPLDASLENEDDAGQAPPRVGRLAPWVVLAARFGRGKQWLDHTPELVVDQRSCHGETSPSRRTHAVRRH